MAKAKTAGAERELTQQQEAFCLEYARCWSVADAARAVEVALPTGYRWMTDPAIKWRVRELAKQLATDVHVEVPNILRELEHLAHFDPARLYGADGRFLPITDLPEHTRKAIKEFEVEERFAGEDCSGLPFSVRVTKVKLTPKEKALELLGKFKKLFGDDDRDQQRKVAININAGSCPHCPHCQGKKA